MTYHEKVKEIDLNINRLQEAICYLEGLKQKIEKCTPENTSIKQQIIDLLLRNGFKLDENARIYGKSGGFYFYESSLDQYKTMEQFLEGLNANAFIIW